MPENPVPAIHTRRPGEKLRLAVVGTANRGSANLGGVMGEEIVALCDVDSNFLGRGVAAVEAAKKIPEFKGGVYADYRRMLDGTEGLDGVVVSTADHTHACIAGAALRRGLAVYCEKPLAQTVGEVRALQSLATEQGVATQMGTQIHAGENYRRVVELIRSGVIGEVREAHVWVGKSWSDGRLGWPQPVPENLDWDLWQGPVPRREYRKGLHPANWRRFWDYGTGTLGDMACHYVDLVHWALELSTPTRTLAKGSELHPVGTPRQMHVTWEHPARGDRPPVTVHWYDGGLRPEGASWGSGQMFVGSKGRLLSDYGKYKLLPEEDFADFQAPDPWIERSIGHYAEWLRAIREGTPTTCNFGYSGDLTTTVLLGNVAFRAGGEIHWSEDEGQVAEEDARSLVERETVEAGFEV